MENTFGSRLSELRKDKKITQEQLARLMTDSGLKTSNKSISKWENGDCEPNVSQFLKLCDVLNIGDIRLAFGESPENYMFMHLTYEDKTKIYNYIDALVKANKYDRIKNAEQKADYGKLSG